MPLQEPGALPGNMPGGACRRRCAAWPLQLQCWPWKELGYQAATLKPGGEGLGQSRGDTRDPDSGQGGHPSSWPTELSGHETLLGTSLVVQGVRLHAPSARGLSLVPAQGARSPMPPQRKVLHVAVKISHVLPLRPSAARKRKRPPTSHQGH